MSGGTQEHGWGQGTSENSREPGLSSIVLCGIPTYKGFGLRCVKPTSSSEDSLDGHSFY